MLWDLDFGVMGKDYSVRAFLECILKLFHGILARIDTIGISGTDQRNDLSRL